MRKSAAVREAADRLYAELAAAGIDVLLDDRDERPGVLFADMELIGIPHRIVLGERGLKQGNDRIPGPARRQAADRAARAAVAVPRGSTRRLMRRGCSPPAAALALAATRVSAGAQKYEPLAASVRARLSHSRSRDQAVPYLAFDTEDEARAGSTRCDNAWSKPHPRPRSTRAEFLRDGALRSEARGPRPAARAGRDRGRERFPQVRRVDAPARAASCR